MKTLSPALASHLKAELSTLARLIKITRTDSVVLGFTDHDRDLVVDGVTYLADSAFQASAMQARQGLSTDNLDIAGILNSAAISDTDIADGKYDHARVDVYLCNWADLSQGVMQLRRGWMGELVVKGNEYQAELRGLHDLLQRPVGSTFTPECRHVLGDSRCAVSLASHTVTGTVTSVLDSGRFYDSARTESDTTFAYGLLTWTSGANTGKAVEVKSYADKLFTLWLPQTQSIATGDGYSVYRGCDKRYETCRTIFSNLANFGGFPHLPGVDRMLNYPDPRV